MLLYYCSDISAIIGPCLRSTVLHSCLRAWLTFSVRPDCQTNIYMYIYIYIYTYIHTYIYIYICRALYKPCLTVPFPQCSGSPLNISITPSPPTTITIVIITIVIITININITITITISTTPSPPTKSFPTKSPRVEHSGRLPIKLHGHENS